MLSATAVPFLVTATLLRPYGLAQDIDLLPGAPSVPITAPSDAPGPKVTAADAERLGRLLDALAAYEADQRYIGSIMGAGAGLGVALTGILIASDSSIPDSNRLGPILIGAGAGLGVASLLIAFMSGTAQDLAEQYARDISADPAARLSTMRATEAALVELRDQTENTRQMAAVGLMVIGVCSVALGSFLLTQSPDDAGRATAAIALGTGAGAAGAGFYFLALGKIPIERFIDTYTPVTLSPIAGSTPRGDTVVGLSGTF